MIYFIEIKELHRVLTKLLQWIEVFLISHKLQKIRINYYLLVNLEEFGNYTFYFYNRSERAYPSAAFFSKLKRSILSTVKCKINITN